MLYTTNIHPYPSMTNEENNVSAHAHIVERTLLRDANFSSYVELLNRGRSERARTSQPSAAEIKEVGKDRVKKGSARN